MQKQKRRESVESHAQLLLVDPQQDSMAFLQRALAGKDRELWLATSCDEARALSQRGSGPDIAVVSVEQPDGCGLELIAEIRSAASPVECIAISGRPTMESARRAMRLGAADYLSRQLHDSAAITQAVDWALDRARKHCRRRLDDRRLQESEERYALAMAATRDGLWDWDLESNRLYQSSRWKQILGCDEGDIGSHPDEWFSRVHTDDLEMVQSTVAQQLGDSSEHFEIDYRMQTRSGSYLWVRTRGISVQDADGKTRRMTGTMSDISRPKAVESRLVFEAMHDGLTQLSNRVAFHQSLLEAFERQDKAPERESFAVLFVDLDRFKNVNDSLGHQAGDELLLEISRRLQASVRESDCLARLGGDEFAILISNVQDMHDVAPLLRRIEEGLRAPCTIQGYPIVPSASIGIAFGKGDCQTPEEILRNADIAMYRAKGQGRAQAEIFDECMHASALNCFQLEKDLRCAIEGKELEVHYQPIFDLQGEGLSGFEALVRWRHSERGDIPPEEFINVAEDCDLIIPLGRQILRTACEQLAAWQRMLGHSLNMSVNLSPKQVFDADIVASIAETLEETGIEAKNLRLEITEGVFMGNLELATFILRQLKTLGVRLCLDDFGTGYASLSYLNNLPFDVLKIDRSFVVGMAGEGKSLVQAILTMAQALGIEVVGEGIELPKQLETLRSLGCNLGQGFWLSRPMTGAAATRMLSDASFPAGSRALIPRRAAMPV